MKGSKIVIFFTVTAIFLLLPPVKSWDLPNPQFIAHISDFLSRYGLIYYFPISDISRIHQYFKNFQRFVIIRFLV